jgi:hypothetical protein
MWRPSPPPEPRLRGRPHRARSKRRPRDGGGLVVAAVLLGGVRCVHGRLGFRSVGPLQVWNSPRLSSAPQGGRMGLGWRQTLAAQHGLPNLREGASSERSRTARAFSVPVPGVALTHPLSRVRTAGWNPREAAASPDGPDRCRHLIGSSSRGRTPMQCERSAAAPRSTVRETRLRASGLRRVWTHWHPTSPSPRARSGVGGDSGKRPLRHRS